MTFSTVKSDPYSKGARRVARSRKLWDAKFWKHLIGLVKQGDATMNDRQLEAIRRENARLYGIAIRARGEHPATGEGGA